MQLWLKPSQSVCCSLVKLQVLFCKTCVNNLFIQFGLHFFKFQIVFWYCCRFRCLDYFARWLCFSYCGTSTVGIGDGAAVVASAPLPLFERDSRKSLFSRRSVLIVLPSNSNTILPRLMYVDKFALVIPARLQNSGRLQIIFSDSRTCIECKCVLIFVVNGWHAQLLGCNL